MTDVCTYLLTLCILNENEIIIVINAFLLNLAFHHDCLSLIHAHTRSYSYLNCVLIF